MFAHIKVVQMSTTATPPAIPPRRPQPGVKPSLTRVFRAVCGYDAQRPTELSYEQDDIIFVSSHEERDGYVQGRNGQQSGLVLAANRECARARTHAHA